MPRGAAIGEMEMSHASHQFVYGEWVETPSGKVGQVVNYRKGDPRHYRVEGHYGNKPHKGALWGEWIAAKDLKSAKSPSISA